ncbi:MAG: helix-turn-helix domain-containing protein [Magnetococcales bacterium]|nr:helix-turn-helix domain-containing protein [Magnetococcales bacterium]
MGIENRLKKALAIKGFDDKEFSVKLHEICGMPKRTAHNYLSGLRSPDAENLTLISARLGINVDWLLTGEGEMFRSPDDSTPVQSLPPDEITLLEAYRRCTERERNLITALANVLADKQTSIQATERKT